jgi:hypothetical protein
MFLNCRGIQQRSRTQTTQTTQTIQTTQTNQATQTLGGGTHARHAGARTLGAQTVGHFDPGCPADYDARQRVSWIVQRARSSRLADRSGRAWWSDPGAAELDRKCDDYHCSAAFVPPPHEEVYARLEARVIEIQQAWPARVGRIRADSATDRLIGALPGAPIVTVNSAGDLIGHSFQQTNEAVARLIDGGVLAQVSIGRRNRAFEAAEIFDAFMDLERELASPQGDTRSSPPVRAIPRRRFPEAPEKSGRSDDDAV